MRPDRTFRRNFVVIAMLHVAFVVGVYLFGSWARKPAEQIIWLEGGSIGGGALLLAYALCVTPSQRPPAKIRGSYAKKRKKKRWTSSVIIVTLLTSQAGKTQTYARECADW